MEYVLLFFGLLFSAPCFWWSVLDKGVDVHMSGIECTRGMTWKVSPMPEAAEVPVRLVLLL